MSGSKSNGNMRVHALKTKNINQTLSDLEIQLSAKKMEGSAVIYYRLQRLIIIAKVILAKNYKWCINAHPNTINKKRK